ncbi:MAG: hypothetical protein GWM98_18785, partial [Nitrospinaceae bacterium]|nr:hypothetical protein [Nitrospinaceae bacterium]
RTVCVGGAAKGAGMIEPGMATMLAFVTTDVGLEPGDAEDCLRQAVSKTFNRITVDGDQSCNDTAMLFANGASGCRLSPASGEGWA